MNPHEPRSFRTPGILLAVTVLVAMMVAPASFAQVSPNGPLAYAGAGTTPAGTVISNSAYADYEDVAGNPAQRVTSNVVQTTVSAVHGVYVNPPTSAKTGNADEITAFAFEVINTGNETDSMVLTPTSVTPTDWVVSVVVDTDGDGVHDAGETQVANSTGDLEPGESAHFHLLVEVPLNTPDNSSATLTGKATSNGDATKSATGTFTLTVSAGVATVVKSINETTSFKPGEVVIYEISTTNTGSVTIDNSTTIDRIPTGTTYVANSMRRGPRGSAYASGIPLTDSASDGDKSDYNVTNPGAISIGPGDLVPGEVSDSIFFQVRINPVAAGTVISNVAVESYAGPNGQIEAESNAVTFTVGASGGSSISPATQSQFAEPGQEVVYFLTVTNNGNASDVLNLDLVSTTGFPWVFYTAEGNPQAPGTPLTDHNSDGLVDTGSVAPGASRSIAVVGTVPSGTQDGAVDSSVVTVSSSIAVLSGTTEASLTTTNRAPRITVAKTVAPTGSAPPGTELTYTTTVNNTGSGTAYQVEIRDDIPEWTTYKANSMRGSVNGGAFAPLTDAAGDDGARYDSTTNAIISVPANMGPGSQAVLEFKVTID